MWDWVFRLVWKWSVVQRVPEDRVGNFDGESRVHVEPLRLLREAIKEIFQGPENNDQTQHAKTALSTSEVLNIHGLILVPVNEETDPSGKS